MSFEDESRRLARIRPNLQLRHNILAGVRSFFSGQGFIEVETPVRVRSVAPERFIEPFSSEDWFLSTSPELFMKRLLASGYDRLFEISHCFRKGESGRRHNPEFTMLEWYRVGADFRKMIEDTQLLVRSLASGLGFGTSVTYLGVNIDLAMPWPRVTVRDAFLKHAGWDPVAQPDEERFDIDLVTKVIPAFDPRRPVVLSGYPAHMASLSKLSSSDRRVSERAEVFIAGLELANAYSELNDPVEQRARFESEADEIVKAGGRSVLPVRFLEAVPHLPDCGGIALGIDRLVMLFCNAGDIRDVIAFPVDEA